MIERSAQQIRSASVEQLALPCDDRLHWVCSQFLSQSLGQTKRARCKHWPQLSLRRAVGKEAERTGFEPADQVTPVTDLANRRFRPLSHLSETQASESAHEFGDLVHPTATVPNSTQDSMDSDAGCKVS
jgi:hypothetical protein